jgi:hypothetical protein
VTLKKLQERPDLGPVLRRIQREGQQRALEKYLQGADAGAVENFLRCCRGHRLAAPQPASPGAGGPGSPEIYRPGSVLPVDIHTRRELEGRREKDRLAGERALRQGKVAAVVLAGGGRHPFLFPDGPAEARPRTSQPGSGIRRLFTLSAQGLLSHFSGGRSELLPAGAGRSAAGRAALRAPTGGDLSHQSQHPPGHRRLPERLRQFRLSGRRLSPDAPGAGAPPGRRGPADCRG